MTAILFSISAGVFMGYAMHSLEEERYVRAFAGIWLSILFGVFAQIL